jgi:phosphatidylinositol 4-kinase type 2
MPPLKLSVDLADAGVRSFSYISEAAASHLDRRLGLSLVPRTELAAISSPAFFYDWIDRTAHVTKGIALPAKVGSFQVRLLSLAGAS